MDRKRSTRPALLLPLAAALMLASSCLSGCPTIDQPEFPTYIPPDSGSPRLYYVDSAAGDDANSGELDAPWKTLARVQAATVPPGSTVYLKNGGLWREKLYPKPGAEGVPVTYASYGPAGKKPLLLGALPKANPGDWTLVPGQVDLWRATGCAKLDAGNIYWVSEDPACDLRVLKYGFKVYSRTACATEFDFWYDAASDAVELRCAGNPASRFAGAGVELALGTSIVTLSNRSWVVFDGLDLRFSGGYGFQGKESTHVTIRNCDISWIGGSQLAGSPEGVKYGNAVEFFAAASFALVEGNRIHDVFDAGLTNQCYDGYGGPASQTDIVYRNNLIWNCGYASVEVWNTQAGAELSRIMIEGNTCAAAGAGFGSGDLPGNRDSNADTAGAHLRFDPSVAATGDFTVRDNVFSGARKACFLVVTAGAGFASWAGWPTLVLDRNCYYDAAGAPLVYLLSYLGPSEHRSYGIAQFAAYQLAAGRDAHSIAADPLFLDAAALDFRLGAASPCLGAGSPGRGGADIDGLPRGDPPDIGAFERP